MSETSRELCRQASAEPRTEKSALMSEGQAEVEGAFLLGESRFYSPVPPGVSTRMHTLFLQKHSQSTG